MDHADGLRPDAGGQPGGADFLVGFVEGIRRDVDHIVRVGEAKVDDDRSTAGDINRLLERFVRAGRVDRTVG